MSESEDESQKTEDPTEKRLNDALQKGQVIHSKEVSNFFVMLTFTLILIFFVPYFMSKYTTTLGLFIENMHQIDVSYHNISHVFYSSLKIIFSILIIPFVSFIIAGFISSFIQIGEFIMAVDTISPKLSKISPLKGFKRIFSFKSVMELIKGIIKIIIVGVVAYIAIKPHLGILPTLHDFDQYSILRLLEKLTVSMMIGITITLALIAILDFLYQRFEYYKALRMSKHDLKEEYKQLEGSPEIKAKLKKIRSERARKRMMSAVPKADVVITNPTHYAVALKYEHEIMSAPIVIAKGADIIAQKIKEVAKENKIPIVENPILAKALYNVEINSEIPIEHYKAVAEVINYVFSLRK